MFISVNKKTSNHRPVKYSALSSGTISHVWYDDDSTSKSTQRRQNHIKLIREIIPVFTGKTAEGELKA